MTTSRQKHKRPPKDIKKAALAVKAAGLKSDLEPARLLLKGGIKLVALHAFSKRPVGLAWNDASNFVTEIDDDATGYGIPLAANRLASVDPDHEEYARKGLAALGLDLESIMAAGTRSSSTRPNSGGRSAFESVEGLEHLSFRVKIDGKPVTALELRATAPNLQDCVPGLVYTPDDESAAYTQQYTNGRTHLDAPPLPADLLTLWRKWSEDHEAFLAAQSVFAEACGADPVLSHCTGKKLPFESPWRRVFNTRPEEEGGVDVETLLIEHGYMEDERNDRYSHPGATGLPGVAPIPGKNRELWTSHHQGDPLCGTFDAWAANVILRHEGDLAAAEDEQRMLFDVPNPNPFTAVAAPEGTGTGSDTSEAEKTQPRPAWKATPTKARLGHKPAPVKFVLKDWLQQRKVGLTAAEGATGKTTLAIWKAAHIVLGRECLGLEVTTPGPVIFISRDDDQEDLDGVLQEIVLAMNPPLSEQEVERLESDLYLISLAEEEEGFLLIEPADKGGTSWKPSRFAGELRAEVERIQPVLVVIDTVRQFTGIESANEAGQIKFMAVCKSLTKWGASVDVLHHVGKQAARERIVDMYSAIGSSALADNARFMWRLLKLEPEDYSGAKATVKLPEDFAVPLESEGGLFQLHSTRGSSRVRNPAPLVYARRGYGLDVVTGARRKSQEERQQDGRAELRQKVLAFFKKAGAEGATTRQVTDSLKGTAEPTREMVKELAEQGVLKFVKKRGPGEVYRLAD